MAKRRRNKLNTSNNKSPRTKLSHKRLDAMIKSNLLEQNLGLDDSELGEAAMADMVDLRTEQEKGALLLWV